jgi:hypothetical protein
MRSRKLLGLFSGLCVLLRLAYSGEALDERVQLTGVLRVQWSDAQGAQGSDGFSLGLARIGARFRADEQTTGLIVVEFASGEGGRAAELVDASLTWQPNARITVVAGQILAPLFYDVRERIFLLETLERGNTTRVFFGGAYLRGGYVAYRVNAQNTLEAGVWNSLAYRDPQLDARGGQAAVAGTLSWRYRSGDTQFAIGGLVGRRPRLQARDANNNPIEVLDSDRRIFYAELEQRIPNTPLKIRADYIWGRDRNPAGGTVPRFLTPSDLQTVFLYAIYEPNPRNQIVLAWEDFDPDTKRGGDRIQTLSLTYHYFVQEKVRLSLCYEQTIEERGNRIANDRVIVAAQYRF